MLHSVAISRRDGKQLSVFLSLCLSKQQYTTNSFGFNPSSNIWLGTIKKFLCFILPPDDKNKKTRIYTRAFTETPISERLSFAKKIGCSVPICKYESFDSDQFWGSSSDLLCLLRRVNLALDSSIRFWSSHLREGLYSNIRFLLCQYLFEYFFRFLEISLFTKLCWLCAPSMI